MAIHLNTKFTCDNCNEQIALTHKFCNACGSNLHTQARVRSEDAVKECPFCAETIDRAAGVCIYCKRELFSKSQAQEQQSSDSTPRLNDPKPAMPSLSGIGADVNFQRLLDDRSFAIFNAELTRARKSTTVAYLLLIFLGGIGGHKFYLGRPADGVRYILLTSFGWGTAAVGIGFIFLAILGFMLIGDLLTIPTAIREDEERLKRKLYTLLTA